MLMNMSKDVYLYRRAIYLVLMIPTRFELDAGALALPSSTSTGQAQSPPLDQSQLQLLPALANDTMTTTLLHLGIIDVSTAKIESLRAINQRISESATATPPPPTATANPSENGNTNTNSNKLNKEDEPVVFIEADGDAVWALLAASVLACDVMAERAQARLVGKKAWRSGPVSAAGLSAFLSGYGSARRSGRGDVLLLPRIVATVS